MAGDWKVRIGGASGFVIDSSAKWGYEVASTWNDKGKVDFVEHRIEIEGDIVDVATQDPAVVAARMFATAEEVSVKLTPRTVELIQDGVVKKTFTPAGSIQSPQILGFRTIDARGNGASRFRYGLSIYVKTPGNNPAGVYDLFTSITEIKDSGKLVRKIWKATCKAKTSAAALSAILTFEPSDDHLHSEVEEFFEDARASGIWIWDAKQKEEVIDFQEEPVKITGFGDDWIESRQVGKEGPKAPVLHLARPGAFVVTIKGSITGFDPAKLQAPPEHYTASATFKRAKARETLSFPTILDRVKGTYILTWEEIWIGTETLSSPDHDGHTLQPLTEAPASQEFGQNLTV